jgi:hypothetical protein
VNNADNEMLRLKAFSADFRTFVGILLQRGKKLEPAAKQQTTVYGPRHTRMAWWCVAAVLVTACHALNVAWTPFKTSSSPLPVARCDQYTAATPKGFMFFGGVDSTRYATCGYVDALFIFELRILTTALAFICPTWLDMRSAER